MEDCEISLFLGLSPLPERLGRQGSNIFVCAALDHVSYLTFSIFRASFCAPDLLFHGFSAAPDNMRTGLAAHSSDLK